ncbi:MAG: pyrroline-5-carboxylate reductase [Parcubacteria group bacterium CG1_02_41_12]|nr:MAG: pyrroline-5-carboxylate reductase [Parcubacteria group bacterium CG1_02_41_12]
MKSTTFGIIGAGVMGTALCENLINKKVARPGQIFICDRDEECAHAFSKRYGVRSKNAREIVSLCDYILLAIKPQDFDMLGTQIKSSVCKKSIVLSIMAGITLQRLRRCLGHERVVRAMPNLAARVGAAMTVYKIGFLSSPKEQKVIGSIFSSFGAIECVSQESLLDAATAISGSGPGYVYLFMEYLIREAEKIGFTRSQAERIVAQTFDGAINAIKESGETPEAMRAKVASKRGTTEAAFNSFKKDKFSAIIAHAVRAAYNRSKKLSQ